MASVMGLELHHPIMSMLWVHGGRSKRRKKERRNIIGLVVCGGHRVHMYHEIKVVVLRNIGIGCKWKWWGSSPKYNRAKQIFKILIK